MTSSSSCTSSSSPHKHLDTERSMMDGEAQQICFVPPSSSAPNAAMLCVFVCSGSFLLYSASPALPTSSSSHTNDEEGLLSCIARIRISSHSSSSAGGAIASFARPTFYCDAKSPGVLRRSSATSSSSACLAAPPFCCLALLAIASSSRIASQEEEEPLIAALIAAPHSLLIVLRPRLRCISALISLADVAPDDAAGVAQSPHCMTSLLPAAATFWIGHSNARISVWSRAALLRLADPADDVTTTAFRVMQITAADCDCDDGGGGDGDDVTKSAVSLISVGHTQQPQPSRRSQQQPITIAWVYLFPANKIASLDTQQQQPGGRIGVLQIVSLDELEVFSPINSLQVVGRFLIGATQRGELIRIFPSRMQAGQSAERDTRTRAHTRTHRKSEREEEERSRVEILAGPNVIGGAAGQSGDRCVVIGRSEMLPHNIAYTLSCGEGDNTESSSPILCVWKF